MFLLYYFQPSWRGIHIRLKAHAPASSSATNMVCLVRRRYLAPCNWFLALLNLFESFYVCYICSYFQMDSFHSGMAYFFYIVYIDLYQNCAQNSRIHQEMEFIFFGRLGPLEREGMNLF